MAEKFIKARFLKFLHQSNLEFIEHAVLCEDYLQRKQTRQIFFVLKQYWEVSRASFVKTPKESFFYVANKWVNLKQNSYEMELRKSKTYKL